MISKKYANDYKIEYAENATGKLKAKAIYTGNYFTYIATGSKIKSAALLFSVLTAISWIAYILPLFVISNVAHSGYIIIPHVSLFIPLIYLSAVAVDLWMTKPPLTREQSDHISLRAPKATTFMILFSSIAVVGFPVYLAIHGSLFPPGDYLFFVCEVLILILSCLIFRKKDLIATCVIGS